MPTVRFAGPPTVKYVSEGAGYLEHQILLSEATSLPVSITVEGPAYRQGDMDVSTQTLTFQPGQTSMTWRVAINEDAQYEGNEVFGFRIASATNATVDMSVEGVTAVRELLGYIVDNDAPAGPTVRFEGPPSVKYVSEGAGYLEHRIVLSQASNSPVTVTVEGQSYRQGDMDVSTQTLTFQPGQTSLTWRVTINEDAQYEGDEVFSFRIASATNAVVDMSVEGVTSVRELLGYIIDNDTPTGPTVRFEGPASVKYVSEGAGHLEHRITLSQASNLPVTVTVEGPGYRQGDMDVSTQTLTFQPGQTSLTWRVAINEDSQYEGDEVFSFRIASATNATVDMSFDGVTAVRELLGYIVDNDVVNGTPGNDQLTADAKGSALLGGSGNDTITGGTAQDYLRGDEGNDQLAGSDAFDDLHGNMGDDTVSGGRGDDWVVGGKDQDLLNGDQGNDIVYGNIGNDWCDGGEGNDIVRGGRDNDVVLGQAGNDWLAGDRGSDTLTGGSGADIFHTFGDAGLDVVTDFNRAEGDRVLLAPGTTYNLTQLGSDTVIDMGGGNQMILVGVSMQSLTGDWIIGA